MPEFQTLYRKYRPRRFDELVGQEHVTGALRNALHEGRVGHAYLFSGPRGTGKTTTARILAAGLNCLALGDDGEPCGICENCVAAVAGRFADLVELDAASNNGVDAIRDLVERVHLGVGATTTRKVYLVDEVHMLSTAASNALLKTLEEPPAHVVFVLATTDPRKVLPTIRSRTQHFEFSLLTVEQLTSHLTDVLGREGVEFEPEAVAAIASRADGSARDALSALDQALAFEPGHLATATVGEAFGRAPADARLAVLEAMRAEDVAGAIAAAGELLESGYDARRVTDELLEALRNAFVLHAADGRVRVDAPAEEQARLRELGDALGSAALLRALETLGAAVVDMRGTDAAEPRLVLEVALVRLTRTDLAPPVTVLAERLERLERTVESLRAGNATPGTPPLPPRAAPGARSRGTGESLGALRRRRREEAPAGGGGRGEADPGTGPSTDAAAATGTTDAPSTGAGSTESAAPGAGAPAEPGPLELDDVIVAWAELLPELSVGTRSAVQDAQPLRIEGDVVVFGVPPALLDAARPRFQRDASQIREGLRARLGRAPRFKLVADEAFGAVGSSSRPPARRPARPGEGRTSPPDPPSRGPSQAPRGGAGPSVGSMTGEPSAGPAADARDDAPDEVVDLDELVDAPTGAPAIDSMTRLQEAFDATVVDEVPRR